MSYEEEQLQGFVKYLEMYYPYLATSVYVDHTNVQDTLAGRKETVDAWWVALAAAGRLHGFAIITQNPYMVDYFRRAVAAITKKLHDLDWYLRTLRR